MKAPLRICLCLILFAICAIAACEKVPETTARTYPPVPDSLRQAPPVANAGADQVIYIPTLSTKLDGTKSTDPNNDIQSYQWKQIAGSSTSIYSIGIPYDKEMGVNFPSVGVYQFELTVKDAASLVSRDTVQVTVIDNFAPGVAPVFVSSCDTMVVAYPENSIYTYSEGAVIHNGETLWLYTGYKYKQIGGPTTASIVHTNGPGSSEVNIQGLLAKGTYAFAVEVERNGLKAYDTTLVRVIDDTSSGKEYYFESTWVLSAGGDQSVKASTPSRPEVFFAKNGGMKEYRLWLKLHNASDWVEIPTVYWMDAEEYYFYTDRCSNALDVYNWGANYRDYVGKKVLMRVYVP